MKNVEVGLFRLPGISFERGELPTELNEEMIAWAKKEGVGMSMTESLWSFKKEAHRDWFVLRWSDSIPKVEKELKLDGTFDKEVKTVIDTVLGSK